MINEPWQVELDAAERYERRLVPALMARWAPRLVRASGVQAGSRVLDVACGTGVVARASAEVVGGEGEVVGLDLNPGMIAVARRIRPHLQWIVGDAASLPFPDASFDGVLCQFAVMFFPDRPAAVQEMHRVLSPGSSAAIATWGDIAVSPPYQALERIVHELAGPQFASIVRAPFVMPDPVELRDLMVSAGFELVEVETIEDRITYPNLDAMLEGEIDATPLGAALHEEDASLLDAVRHAVRDALAPLAGPQGITFPAAANVGTGRVPLEGRSRS